MITLKALLVTAPPELREQLQGRTKMALIERCAGVVAGAMSICAAVAAPMPNAATSCGAVSRTQVPVGSTT